MFSQACVKNSVHGGGGWGVGEGMGCLPLGAGGCTSPWVESPPLGGRYASYWNAFLFLLHVFPCSDRQLMESGGLLHGAEYRKRPLNLYPPPPPPPNDPNRVRIVLLTTTKCPSSRRSFLKPMDQRTHFFNLFISEEGTTTYNFMLWKYMKVHW